MATQAGVRRIALALPNTVDSAIHCAARTLAKAIEDVVGRSARTAKA